MIISVESEFWRCIFYQIRDHILEGEEDRRPNELTTEWLERRFAEMGIRLVNDGSLDKKWTHVEILVDPFELFLRWSQ